MHKSQLGALIIDCNTDDLTHAAKFWAAALGLEPESAEDPTNEKYLRLTGKTGDVNVLLQKVGHQSRIHIDIETDDRDREVARLEALGAKIVDELERWTVMEAPSGHRFCIISPAREGFDENATAWT